MVNEIPNYSHNKMHDCYPRRAWADTGIVVYDCLFVCLFVICESTYLDAIHCSTAFTAWIASTQQIISFKSGRFRC